MRCQREILQEPKGQFQIPYVRIETGSLRSEINQRTITNTLPTLPQTYMMDNKLPQDFMGDQHISSLMVLSYLAENYFQSFFMLCFVPSLTYISKDGETNHILPKYCRRIIIPFFSIKTLETLPDLETGSNLNVNNINTSQSGHTDHSTGVAFIGMERGFNSVKLESIHNPHLKISHRRSWKQVPFGSRLQGI